MYINVKNKYKYSLRKWRNFCMSVRSVEGFFKQVIKFRNYKGKGIFNYMKI